MLKVILGQKEVLISEEFLCVTGFGFLCQSHICWEFATSLGCGSVLRNANGFFRWAYRLRELCLVHNVLVLLCQDLRDPLGECGSARYQYMDDQVLALTAGQQ